jgi:hypothetical protein
MIHAWCLFSWLAAPAIMAQVDDPWADEVIEYSATDPVPGFTDPLDALGAPFGLDPNTPANEDNTVSIGTPSGSPRGRLVLKFDTPIEDDPLNPMGLDFIVFSNAFWVGGNPQRRFQEPGIVEISPDGIDWYLIPGSRKLVLDNGSLPLVSEPDGDSNSLANPYLLAGNIRNPNDLLGGDSALEYNWGYADLSPTLAPFLDNYVRPDNPYSVGVDAGTGGGDAFDIAWAVNEAGEPAALTEFSYIRISPFVSRNLVTAGLASPEITAVADVAPNIDTDGDGILDEFEVRVAGTDPTRPESTILPLQIPAFEGGSPQGTVLGIALHAKGHALTFLSDGPRTQSDHTATVDLLPTVPGAHSLSKVFFQISDRALDIESSVPDFIAAELAAAEVAIAYRPTQIEGLDELGLEPFRLEGGQYVQTGISSIAVEPAFNRVTFRSTVSGRFALAGPTGIGDTGLSTVWVDFAFTGPEHGTQTNPYARVADGQAGVIPGGTVRLVAGSSVEVPRLERTARYLADSGPVRIGVSGLSRSFESESLKSGFITRK